MTRNAAQHGQTAFHAREYEVGADGAFLGDEEQTSARLCALGTPKKLVTAPKRRGADKLNHLTVARLPVRRGRNDFDVGFIDERGSEHPTLSSSNSRGDVLTGQAILSELHRLDPRCVLPELLFLCCEHLGSAWWRDLREGIGRTSPNKMLRWCLAPAVMVCPYGADPQLRAPAIAISRGGIGGYF
jgi:hypothetical protein